MLWLKALHLIFMVTWFAGLFYLPRLFVYHALTDDDAGKIRFQVMERKLLIMTHIGMTLTWVFGLSLLASYAWDAFGDQLWLHIKLACLLALTFYTAWCGRIVRALREGRDQHSHVWFRWFNEIPALFLFAIVLLAVLKPS